MARLRLFLLALTMGPNPPVTAGTPVFDDENAVWVVARPLAALLGYTLCTLLFS